MATRCTPQVFAQYGTLQPGTRGVNLKSQKDKPSFAFIEFEQPAAAAAAMSAMVRPRLLVPRPLSLHLAAACGQLPCSLSL